MEKGEVEAAEIRREGKRRRKGRERCEEGKLSEREGG